jgi:hypothetical protein
MNEIHVFELTSKCDGCDTVTSHVWPILFLATEATKLLSTCFVCTKKRIICIHEMAKQSIYIITRIEKNCNIVK